VKIGTVEDGRSSTVIDSLKTLVGSVGRPRPPGKGFLDAASTPGATMMLMAAQPSRPRDPNQLGKLIVDIATGESDEPAIPTAKPNGRARGGEAGGKARADALSAERRRAIAKKAALTRWAGEQAPN
jgi:hypothetical protein